MRIIWLQVVQLVTTTLVPLLTDLLKDWLSKKIERESLKVSVNSTL